MKTLNEVTVTLLEDEGVTEVVDERGVGVGDLEEVLVYALEVGDLKQEVVVNLMVMMMGKMMVEEKIHL